MKILIKRTAERDGTVYEIADFQAYVKALADRGIQAPKAKYRIVLPKDVEQALRVANIDIEDQIALFFRIGPSSELDYQIIGP
jgi:hypothetical protein